MHWNAKNNILKYEIHVRSSGNLDSKGASDGLKEPDVWMVKQK